ncbi:TetR/AcrR family transcriptional regulator [Sphingomonas sp. R-74633]|uniref:TetR/AcrR family transcriptional regulator n=1 Tax=Sphingomonas sp. R-74633 TaxID=2751188 RepID=UPI0015D399D0|nr:TetR/AcrR family transcriptional regulator [Sphingomonas sp. R-74633]NYT42147.1 TetR/AcrR family transcriptional regulator [Sphingomonas sp. R-74633]
MESEAKGRNRARTQETILAAARQLLAEQGFPAWGVNAIARAAGCDKQLIYRYFGGVDGLAAAIGEEMTAWLDTALAPRPDAPSSASYADLMARLATEYLEALRANRLAQRILAWEVAEDAPLPQSFATARDKAITAWIHRERGNLMPREGVDGTAANAVLIAGVQHLVLAGAASGRFSGLRLNSDRAWERIRTAVEAIALAAYR